MTKNLNIKVKKTATNWKGRAVKDRLNRKSITRSQAFALELLDYLESNKIKQTDLALKMNVTPQQVNKILRAKSNLTFETLDKIADALGVEISNPKIISKRKVQLPMLRSDMQVVYRKPAKLIQANITTNTKVEMNPLLETSLENLDEYKFTADEI